MGTQVTNIPTSSVKSRSETHRVRVDMDVSGFPAVQGGKGGKRWITPSALYFLYTRVEGHWWVEAQVYGRWSPEVLLNDWVTFHARRIDEWPDWLRELAEQQHPQRHEAAPAPEEKP